MIGRVEGKTDTLRRVLGAAGQLALIWSLLVALSAPSWADVGVFVRFGNGAVIACPREAAIGFVTRDGAIILNTLPYGYILGTDYYEGYPAYYPYDGNWYLNPGCYPTGPSYYGVYTGPSWYGGWRWHERDHRHNHGNWNHGNWSHGNWSHGNWNHGNWNHGNWNHGGGHHGGGHHGNWNHGGGHHR